MVGTGVTRLIICCINILNTVSLGMTKQNDFKWLCQANILQLSLHWRLAYKMNEIMMLLSTTLMNSTLMATWLWCLQMSQWLQKLFVFQVKRWNFFLKGLALQLWAVLGEYFEFLITIWQMVCFHGKNPFKSSFKVTVWVCVTWSWGNASFFSFDLNLIVIFPVVRHHLACKRNYK